MRAVSLVTILYVLSCTSWAWANDAKIQPSPFDITPLNSPVKESEARFLLKIPSGFSIDKTSYLVIGPRIFKKSFSSHKDTKLYNTPEGPELRIPVTNWKSGAYRLFVKIKDKKKKEHDFKRTYRDYVPFAIAVKAGDVKEPDPKKNNSTLLGIDTDNNGVRDDIQIWIEKSFANSPPIIQAFNEYAIQTQETYKNKDNIAESNLAKHAATKALNCLLRHMREKNFTGSDILDYTSQFKAMFTNTKLRIDAEEKVSENYHGEKDVMLPKEIACEF